MNLYDPNRPKIFHKPAFLPGQYPIPHLQLWPLPNGKVEISLMLPLKDERFAGKYFRLEINLNQLPTLVQNFIHDPEEFINEHFGSNRTNSPNFLLPAI